MEEKKTNQKEETKWKIRKEAKDCIASIVATPGLIGATRNSTQHVLNVFAKLRFKLEKAILYE